VNALPTHLRDADLALARRDGELPSLATVLDDDRLSELVGEQIHVTRVRYKPRTSALVAFHRAGNGKEDYGWAFTTAPADNGKLYGRARSSESRGGGIRLLRPDPHRWEEVVAVGGIEDDWALRKNLCWLGSRGLKRLGAVPRPERELLGGAARVLRYKPERRLVLMEQTPDAPIVIKIAAQLAPDDVERPFQQLLELHGVPVLPRLGDAACSRHGISASPKWGDGDLLAVDDPECARRAGEALARLHGIPAQVKSCPARHEDLQWQITATRKMVGALLPALEGPAAMLAERLRRRLLDPADHGNRVLVHGDFSADQVLVSGSEVRLIDFDRAHTGTAEADVGSFAAVEEMSQWRRHSSPARAAHTEHLLDGYARSGGRFRPAAVDAWAAFRMFSNSVDPFRDRTPEWAADMSRHLDRASELVS
jgi:thiamine kinase-like enzyme